MKIKQLLDGVYYFPYIEDEIWIIIREKGVFDGFTIIDDSDGRHLMNHSTDDGTVKFLNMNHAVYLGEL